MVKRWCLILVVLASLVGAGVLIVLLSFDRRSPAFTVDEIAAIEVHLSDWGDQQTAAKVRTHDATKIQAVITELAKGVRTSDHKCGDSGNIILHRKDGGQVQISILSGHHAQFYEFRVSRSGDSGYRIFKTERAPFLHAMAKLGLTKLAPGSPE